MTEAVRDVSITVRLARREKKMLDELAQADGVSASDAIRMAIRRQHESRLDARKKGS